MNSIYIHCPNGYCHGELQSEQIKNKFGFFRVVCPLCGMEIKELSVDKLNEIKWTECAIQRDDMLLKLMGKKDNPKK
jgi:hypothetical protein